MEMILFVLSVFICFFLCQRQKSIYREMLRLQKNQKLASCIFTISFVIVLFYIKKRPEKGVVLYPKKAEKYFHRFMNLPSTVLSGKKLLKRINQINTRQTIYNNNKFKPLTNDSFVIVVQVHKRIGYLRYLIASLSQVNYMRQALVIFSHDYYDEEINRLIRLIDFCKVIQIFYPFSLQLYPNKFPGQSPYDCPKFVKSNTKCSNILYPDTYGHYREAKVTQAKHHWWWKANTVFNHLKIMKRFNGFVLFLEEDNYVLQDTLYVLSLLNEYRKKSCKICNVLSLGTQNLSGLYNRVANILPWSNIYNNIGMAFNRTTWNEILNCAEGFCRFDDYNWDWTLYSLSQSCLKHQLVTLAIDGTRVFHIGQCGMHYNEKNCMPEEIVKSIVIKFGNMGKQYFLYPHNLTIHKPKTLPQSVKNHGGWSDPRDNKLCIAMTY